MNLLSISTVRAASFQSAYHFFSAIPAFLSSVSSLARVILTEAYANFRHVLPNFFRWTWRKYVKGEMTSFRLQFTAREVTKVAYLTLHSNLSQIREGQTIKPVLFCHGDHSHPSTLLHLIDKAQEKRLFTCSLFIPGIYCNEEHNLFNGILKETIDKIEALVRSQQGIFEGLLGVGHSKGSILLAYKQFVDLDPRLKATCAIGGRLNAPEDSSCQNRHLRELVRAIYHSLTQYPTLPLVQIIPQEDWHASYESMAVRPHNRCYSVPGMHLSGLYTAETSRHFIQFLEEFA